MRLRRGLPEKHYYIIKCKTILQLFLRGVSQFSHKLSEKLKPYGKIVNCAEKIRLSSPQLPSFKKTRSRYDLSHRCKFL